MRSRQAFSEQSDLIRLFAERSGVGQPPCPPDQVIATLVEGLYGRRTESQEQRLQRALKDRNVLAIDLVPDLNSDGMLEPVGSTFNDGFRMQLKRDVSGGRMRFTMAHEVCHTFFYELVPEVKFRPHETDRAEERLCNVGAAALLIPASSLKAQAKSLPICLSSLEQLAVGYSVSPPAMLLRLKALRLWKCELSNWHHTTSGTFVVDRLYGGQQVEWEWEDVSLLNRAWESNASIFGTGIIHLNDGRGVRRYRPVVYNMRRSAAGVEVLWGVGIRQPAQNYPLLAAIGRNRP